LRAVLGPELVSITAQQLTFLSEVGIPFDIALVNAEAVEWATGYGYDLVTGLTNTTRTLVSRATAAFMETPGMTRADLVGMLEPAFGSVRAEMIAVTEVTRAASQSTNIHQRLLAHQGIQMRRVWQTRHDSLVCEICGPLNGQPEDVWHIQFPSGPPAHPRCRCGLALTARELEDIQAEADRLAGERARYMAGLVQP